MTNNKTAFIWLLASLFMISSACSSKQYTVINGTIDYLGDADFYVEAMPLHYKYSEKIQFPVTVSGTNFSISIPLDKPTIVYLAIQDTKYPLFVEPGGNTSVTILRSEFPSKVRVTGIGENANSNYQKFLDETVGLQSSINAEMEKSKNGNPNNARALSAEKVRIAKNHLEGTNFNDIYQKTIGEDFVIKLRTVEYNARFFTDYDVDKERQMILDEAVNSGFFSYSSLKAQRAGIRDFTHYYARTFGIYDSVKTEYNADLAEYDIKRVAYDELNEKRMQVLKVIEDPKAKAYAEMFLIAERIGEIPLHIAEDSYRSFLTEYADYPEFTEFIEWFYNEIKSVSPGEPAIPFTLADENGKLHSMSDYLGKFVLLDFWAGWCQPCLHEFPIMRDIYSTYTRDQLEIVGISTEIDSLVWRQDIQRFKNPWPQLYGGNGFNQETFKAYKGGGIPFYILVDPDGNIVRYNDMRPSFNFTEVLDSLLLHQESQKASL